MKNFLLVVIFCFCNVSFSAVTFNKTGIAEGKVTFTPAGGGSSSGGGTNSSGFSAVNTTQLSTNGGVLSIKDGAAFTNTIFRGTLDISANMNVTGTALFDSSVTMSALVPGTGTHIGIDGGGTLVTLADAGYSIFPVTNLTTGAFISADSLGSLFFRGTNVNAYVPAQMKYGGFDGAVGLNLGTNISGANPTLALLRVAGQSDFGYSGATKIESGGNVIISNQTAALASLAVYASNNPTPSLIVNSNGNVGIGTATPRSVLDVVQASGNTYSIIDGVAASEVGFSIRKSGIERALLYVPPSQTYLSVYLNGGTRMVVTDAGSVGIGTTTPTNLLELSSSTGPVVEHNNSSTAIAAADTLIGAEMFTSSDTSSAGAGEVGSIRVYSSTAYTGTGGRSRPGYMDFYLTTDVTARGVMRITDSGNVGIGTTAPSAKLTVIATNGATIATYQTNAPTGFATSGWTNTTGGNVFVSLTGITLATTKFETNGTALFAYAAVTGSVGPLPLKPWQFITTTGTITTNNIETW